MLVVTTGPRMRESAFGRLALLLAFALCGCSATKLAEAQVGLSQKNARQTVGAHVEPGGLEVVELQPTSIPLEVLDSYCLSLGYQIENRAPLPECEPHMVCVFPDNTDCSLSEFVSGICGAKHSFCEQQGGELTAGVFVGSCKLAGGKVCPELEHWRGICGDE